LAVFPSTIQEVQEKHLLGLLFRCAKDMGDTEDLVDQVKPCIKKETRVVWPVSSHNNINRESVMFYYKLLQHITSTIQKSTQHKKPPNLGLKLAIILRHLAIGNLQLTSFLN